MKKKKTNLPDKKKGGKPVSKQAIYSSASSHALEAINRLASLMQSKNEPVAVSASKALLAKSIPDLKATELDVKEGMKFKFEIVKDTTLEDANKKDPAKDKKLPSSGSNIQPSS
jgi:hypothetical protein